MAETPSGMLNNPMLLLETLLSECDSFQSWVGEVTAEAAKDHINWVATESGSRPFALIMEGEEFELDGVGDGEGMTYVNTGSLKLRFDDDVNASYAEDPKNAEIEFKNYIGAILSDMIALSGTDDYMAIHMIRKMWGPRREARDKKKSAGGQYNQILFYIGWGP